MRLDFLPAKTFWSALQDAQSFDQITRLQHLDELQRDLGLPRARGNAYLPRTEDHAADNCGCCRNIECCCKVHQAPIRRRVNAFQPSLWSRDDPSNCIARI